MITDGIVGTHHKNGWVCVGPTKLFSSFLTVRGIKYFGIETVRKIRSGRDVGLLEKVLGKLGSTSESSIGN